MYEIKSIDVVGRNEISALDLIAELHKIGASEDVVCARVVMDGGGEQAQAIYIPALGRAGVACGGDAVWTDCSSLDDGCRRVLVTGKVIE